MQVVIICYSFKYLMVGGIKFASDFHQNPCIEVHEILLISLCLCVFMYNIFIC
jgi:hypothetical protein